MPVQLSSENLQFSFDKKPLLQDVNLTFKAGEFVGLIVRNFC